MLSGNPLGDTAVQELINAMAYNRELAVDIKDEHGDSMGDDVFARLAAASALEYPAREYLDLCMDAWTAWTGGTPVQQEFSFWTEAGFSVKAASFVGTELANHDVRVRPL